MQNRNRNFFPGLNISTGKLLQNGRSCPTGSLKKIISYRPLKFQKHSARNIGLPCSFCCFYEHFKQLFYIQNRKMCFSKKILYQHFATFLPARNSFISEKISHSFFLMKMKNLKENINHLWLFKLGKLNKRHLVS